MNLIDVVVRKRGFWSWRGKIEEGDKRIGALKEARGRNGVREHDALAREESIL